jgi:hypothetical protein
MLVRPGPHVAARGFRPAPCEHMLAVYLQGRLEALLLAAHVAGRAWRPRLLPGGRRLYKSVAEAMRLAT